MYAAVGPALRSASIARPQARIIRRRRFPLSHRAQSFHSTRHLAQNSPPPSAPDAPIDENDVDKRSGEKAVVAAEQPDNGIVTDDADVLAQKLQRSREMTRRYSSALKRSQRRNRAQDLPPIHIPDWFLERRVRLRTGSQKRARRGDYALTIRNTETGQHGTCSIPLSTYSTGVKSISDMFRAMWGKNMSDKQRAKFARDIARRMGREDDLGLVKALERGDDPDVATLDDKARRKGGMDEFNRTLEQAVAGREADEEQYQQKVTDAFKNRERELHSGHTQLLKGLNRLKRISPLLRAEIRAAIAGSLSSVQPAIHDSFPSAKTNLILHSPTNETEPFLTATVEELASELGADLITLDPLDLAQIAGDYLGEGGEPTPHSIRSLSYEAYRYGSDLIGDIEELSNEDNVEEEQDGASEIATSSPSSPHLIPGTRIPVLASFAVALKGAGSLRDLSRTLQNSHVLSSGQAEGISASSSAQPTRTQSQSDVQLEDLKLSTLLEALVEADELKRTRDSSTLQTGDRAAVPRSMKSKEGTKTSTPKFFDFSIGDESPELDFSDALPNHAKPGNTFTVGPSTLSPKLPQNSKIIHIKDIKELNTTQYGSRILAKLEEIVRKQRNAGQSIMLIGTTSSMELTPELTPSGVQGLQSEGDAGLFRTIFVPVMDNKHGNFYTHAHDNNDEITSAAKARLLEKVLSQAERRRFLEINTRHIQDMLRSLDPNAAKNFEGVELPKVMHRSFGRIHPESYLWGILTYDEVHRIALTAIGLHLLDPSNEVLSWAHVVLAMGLLKASDEMKFASVKLLAAAQSFQPLQEQFREQMDKLRESLGQEPLQKPREHHKRSKESVASIKRQQDLARINMTATKHEKRLLHGIANPDQIKTTFDQIHVPKETIEAIRTLTSLSLIRPDAFNYGVLSTEKISGALLYGPPGTGKTLLAKAVAKESGSIVLEVSGSQIMDKYVGEGEKNVTAIFSLARKLSPCIVFLDEADAIFGSRDSSRDRSSHRDILNQFLKEWDGLNDVSVFVMVATNRPFDMDDAVIRRLPRRLLVDLPTQEDRKKIMEIHLRGEQLDESVDLDALAERTPLYSGSDLKNVAVFAALACVREENEQAAIAAAAKAVTESMQTNPQPPATEPSPTMDAQTRSPDPPPPLVQGQNYDFPDRRTLHLRHFDKALQEVSASISEDMSSLNAIKKFDEQYGDKRGNRKKKAYGFGVSVGKNENAARVRT